MSCLDICADESAEALPTRESRESRFLEWKERTNALPAESGRLPGDERMRLAEGASHPLLLDTELAPGRGSEPRGSMSQFDMTANWTCSKSATRAFERLRTAMPLCGNRPVRRE